MTKLVGLISGGKDSIFNLLHCVANGHEIIALANLHPGYGKCDELDSYMYQTVGHSFVPAVADCMSLPLIRRSIERKSISTDCLYDENEDDEVEELYCLLHDVLSSFQDIGGVAVGAVLSNYQRVRVENVCSRLGLQVFAYLWRVDQFQLLADMEQCGLQAILVKVASMGLNSTHVGMLLSDVNYSLQTLHKKWGIHPAGEGGEYETITVDCPLFTKKLIIHQFDIIQSSEEVCAAAFLTNARFELVEKEMSEWDLSLCRALNYLRSKYTNSDRCSLSLAPSTPLTNSKNDELSSDYWQIYKSDDDSYVTFLIKSVLDFSNLHHTFDELAMHLETNELSFSNIVMVNVVLRDMKLFSGFNEIYSKYFGCNHPAARSCISDYYNCTRLEIIVCRQKRTALHVQSVSYWAPANIGPYSQAVKVTEKRDIERLFLAGQIGLIPENMHMPHDMEREAELSICHVNSIVNAITNNVTSTNHSNYSDNNVFIASAICFLSNDDAYHAAVKLYRTKLPGTAAAIFIQVASLPRGANIEWLVSPVLDAKHTHKVSTTSNGSLIYSCASSDILLSNDIEEVANFFSQRSNCISVHYFTTLSESVLFINHGHVVVAKKITSEAGIDFNFAAVAHKIYE